MWARLRGLLLLGLLLVVLAVGLLLRRLGWAEAGVLVALAGLAFVVESTRFIWRQFDRGLRGAPPRAAWPLARLRRRRPTDRAAKSGREGMN